jgi:uncharacterized protein with PIN domain
MVIDSSAVIAILCDEPDAKHFATTTSWRRLPI